MNNQSKEAWQNTIPVTSPKCYLTGLPALSLPAPEGTTGDSNFMSVFYDINKSGKKLNLQLAGEAQVLNTNHIYGEYGIYECSEGMRKLGLYIPEEIAVVYAANHYRAILDLLYDSLRTHQQVIGLTGTTEEWLDTPEQKVLVLEKAAQMLPFLSEPESEELRRWIEKERQPGYWS